MKRELKIERGGRGSVSFLSSPPPSSLTRANFSRGLCFPVFDSRNSTETVATQASEIARALAIYGTENGKRRTSRKSSEDLDLLQVDLLASGESLFWPRSGESLVKTQRAHVPTELDSIQYGRKCKTP